MIRLSIRLKAVEREKGERGYRERQCKLFLKTISNLGADDGVGAGDMPEERLVDKEMFLTLVDKVGLGDGLTFILRDGRELEA